MDDDPPPKWGAIASANKANPGFQEQTPTVDNVVSETPPAHAVQFDEPSEVRPAFPRLPLSCDNTGWLGHRDHQCHSSEEVSVGTAKPRALSVV